MREQLPALTLVCPLLVGIAMPLIGLAKRAWCRPITLGALGAMNVLAVASYVAILSGGEVRYAFSGWAAPIGIEWIADGLSSLLLVVLALLALTAVVYGGPLTPQGLGNRIVPYYTLIMLLMTGLTGMVMSGDLFNVFVFLEVASLSSYGLVGVAGGPALLASFRYLILGTIGASFYLLGVAYFYAVTGTLNMADLAHRLPELLESKAVIAGLIFMMIGLGIKMALVPLHGWLPDAYTHAPDAITPLVAPLVTKVAMFAVIRIMFWVLGANTVIYEIPVLMIVGWVAAMATIVGAFLALNQQDVKRLFTYAGISHIGLIVMGVSMGNETGFAGGIFYLINDAIMQATLFFVVGTAAYRHGARTLQDFYRLRERMPWTVGALIVSALSMIGIPPTGGFFGKWYILLGALEAKNYVAVGTIIVVTLLTLAYFVRILDRIFHDTRPVPTLSGAEAPLAMRVGLGVLSATIIALGLWSSQVIGLILRTALPVGL